MAIERVNIQRDLDTTISPLYNRKNMEELDKIPLRA